MLKLKYNREVLTVLLSVAVQVPLAVFLGHAYDERAFMDAGYLVASGLNPYIPHFITIFPNQGLVGYNPIIGYPPLWALLLGLIYRLTFGLTPNLFLYNFGIKMPVIAGNIGLAYATKAILKQSGVSETKVQAAWLFLLFNPFVLLTTTAWGQFDTLVALFCLASLYFLSKGHVGKSAILLSLGIVLKPVALPLIGLPLIFAPTKSWRKNLTYVGISAAIIVTLWFGPFYLLNWATPLSATQRVSYFQMAGGMTPFNLIEVLQQSITFPPGLGFLGYIWIPALILGYYLVYRTPPKSLNELMQKAIFLVLVFFLTRSWLSEQNMNLIFPLALVALPMEDLNFRNFNFLWVIPLIFMFFNTSLPQLFFLVSPRYLITLAAQVDAQIKHWRDIGRFVIVVVLQVFAWRLTAKMLNVKLKPNSDPRSEQRSLLNRLRSKLKDGDS